MILQALTVGYAFPKTDFQGEVHSIFHRALNLRIRAGENRLVTLVLPAEDDLPQGARISAPGGFDFTAQSLSHGQAVACQSGVLTCARNALAFDLRAARIWRSDLAGLSTYPGAELSWPAWMAAYEVLAERWQQNPSGLNPTGLFADAPLPSDALTRRAWAGLRGLWSAGRARDGAAVPATEPFLQSAVESLVGLGPGLTPSGDDFLVGFLAGVWATAGYSPNRRAYAARLAQAVRQAAHRTGEISRSFLIHACQAQVSRRLYELASALCTAGSYRLVREKAARVMDSGHTSGMDTTAGLLAGLIIWQEPGIGAPLETTAAADGQISIKRHAYVD